jgi:23S rRNA G2445 N2-methylase RlmL
MAIKKAKRSSVLLDDIVKGIEDILKTHRHSLSVDEVKTLEQGIILLKESKKTGTEINYQSLTLRIVEIMLRFFLFSGNDGDIGDLL